MRPSSIKYYFKEGIGSLVKNRLMTIASVATVAASIFIMAFSYCLVNNLQFVLKQMEENIGIAVFLSGTVSATEIETMKEDILAIPHVSEVQYVSPDDALDELAEEWEVQDDILVGLNGENNPLPNTLKISLEGIEYQNDVLAQLESMPGIDKVSHAKSETEILLKVNDSIKYGGVLVFVGLAAISVVIIMNTIKISVYSRRNEINIMKFVGATDWFIRWPFIIEGILIGIMGAVFPMLLAWPLYAKAVDLIYVVFPMLTNTASFRLPLEIFSVLVPMALIFGIVLGVFGSISSMRKHLRV